ncbi:MAG: InlB B-repeat-containing protein [Lachnospiraceae bacterium]|nr:InlB B-repeat-containing protein [Lachnospiraceae bacterium]
MKIRNRKVNRLVTALMTLTLCVGDLSVPKIDAHAAWEKTMTGLSLGTGSIIDPRGYDRLWYMEEGSQPWSGCYVYYGNYNNTPLKYRVLDNDSDEFGVNGGSLLLDCDTVIKQMRFDDDSVVWADSELRAWLNGSEFLNSPAVFTDAERTAIASSSKSDRSAKDVEGWSTFTPLSHDRVFVLDYAEVMRRDYGYYDYSLIDPENSWGTFCNKEGGYNGCYWLRSKAEGNYSYDGDVYSYADVAFVGGGFVDHGPYSESRGGVSPVFNVKRSSVIFSSMLNDPPADFDPAAPLEDWDNWFIPEYKLTLKDEGLAIGPSVARKSGNGYALSYGVVDNSDAEPDRVSVVVTDGTWTDKGWSDGAKLLQYTELSRNKSEFTLNGTGMFSLAGNVKGTWGKDYHVYILAEDVRGEKESDLASAPAEVRLTDTAGICNVAFKLKGAGSVIPNQFVEKGGKVTEPAAVKGYVIKGWYTEEGLENKWDFATDTVDGSSMTLWADWSEAQSASYTVSFDMNGHGGTAPAAQSVKEGGKATEPTAPTDEDYNFGGWFREKACTNRWGFSTDTVEDDTTLYAKWTQKPEIYTVTFDMNGVDGKAPEPQSVEDGSLLTTPKYTEAAGYTFGGWYKDKGCTEKWDFSEDRVSGNTTLYASWKRIEGYCVVSFDLNGVSVSGNAPENKGVKEGNTVKAPAAPTAEGYTFDGWYKEKECTNAWDFDTDTVTADTRLYAKWTKIAGACIVSFDLNDVSGTAPEAKSVAKDGKVTEPTAPVAEGYTFDGWYKEKACKNAWDFDTDTVTDDITLYAKWTKKSDPDNPDINVSGNSALDPVPVITDATTELWLVKGQKFTLKGWSLDDQDSTKLKAYKKLISMAKNGKVKVKNPGTAVIVKKDVSGNVVQSISVNISKPELSNKKLKLEAGSSGKDTGSVALRNAENIAVYYYSASPDVAEVDQDGNVTALSKGSAKITVYANGVAYNATVTVKEPTAVKERTLHLAAGAPKTVKLAGVKKTVWDYAEGTTEDEKAFVSIKNAKVTAGKNPGTVTLTAKGDLSSYTMTVKVDDISLKEVHEDDKYDLKKIKTNKYKLVIAAGEELTLDYVDLDQPVVYRNSNAEAAFVDEDGNVQARTKGSCKFTAKIDGKTVTITVNVV